jgi:Fuc2NAc and GlcNAc transferase
MSLDINKMIFAALFSLAISALCSFIFLRFGRRWGLMDAPNERSSHSVVTPRGGGIGISLSFIAVCLFLYDEWVLAGTVGAVGFLGLLEDRFGFSSNLRLLAQVAISSVAVLLIFGMPEGAMEILLDIFWIVFVVATMNMYNFMDGVDGIAGLTGVVGFGLAAIFSFSTSGDAGTAGLCIAVAFSCLGFLPFNFPRARLFMGDAGSLAIGAIFALIVARFSTDLNTFLCMVMFIGLFFSDSLLTVIKRWRRGERLSVAHRAHLYQVMSNELGLPHWAVSLSYASVQLLTGSLSILFHGKGTLWMAAFAGIYLIVFTVVYGYVGSLRSANMGCEKAYS